MKQSKIQKVNNTYNWAVLKLCAVYINKELN